MASSSWFRLLLNRLTWFTRPIPLMATVATVVLGISLVEYVKHPEWFGAYSPDADDPQDTDLSGLTPEEQAALAEIDTLALLLNELVAPPDSRPTLRVSPGADTDGAPEDATADFSGFLTAAAGDGRFATAESAEGSPFDQYLEQYQFLGSSSGSAVSDGQGSTGLAETGLSAPEADSPFTASSGAISPRATALPVSPLTYILQERQRVAGEAPPPSNLLDALTEGRDARRQPQATTAPRTTTGLQSQAQQDPATSTAAQTVTIPGVPYPVLPTRPQMSPPPGTTGYTPPASLELLPPLPYRTPTSSSAAGNSLPAATSGFNLGSPQVDVSNGSVTPYSSVQPGTPAPAPLASPAPFSAPRPPGVYTGGGYINTFSNPSAPPQQ